MRNNKEVMSETINVLLSAYNGENYIEQQLASILEQTDQDLRIFIRDDGSADKTVSLVRERFAKELSLGKIVLIRGSNIGYSRSFLELLRLAEDGAFWAFCDQDDVWLPEKLAWARQWLEKQPADVPALYHGSYRLTDENLRPTGTCLPPAYPLCLRRMITDCVFQGFSIVLNAALREELLRAESPRAVPHDWLAGMIAVRFGRFWYDERITALHRRLPHSASSLSLGSRLKWFFGVKRGQSDITRAAAAFCSLYEKELTPKERKLLHLFADTGSGWKAAYRKAFYPARWRNGLASELALRLLMLTGKI